LRKFEELTFIIGGEVVLVVAITEYGGVQVQVETSAMEGVIGRQ
jgi:uncharacterized protein YjfI (DUF2170 family)